MKREHSIPLFLWIAAAICVHAIFGGGADEAAERISEQLDVRDLAAQARSLARAKTPPLEVEFDVSEPEPEAPTEPTQEPSDNALDPTKEDPQQKPDKPAEPREKEKAKPKEKAPPKEKPVQKEPEPKKPTLLPVPATPPPPPKPPEPPLVVPDRRVAVKQHVEDPKQEDNPNARFAAEQANRVENETQARITSTDQNSKVPDPGSGPKTQPDDPGNSKESRVASSEERPGEKLAPLPEAGESKEPSKSMTNERAETSKSEARAAAAERVPEKSPAKAQPDLLAGESGTNFGGTRSSPNGAKRDLPPSRPTRPIDILGYGSEARTSRGIRLNLSPAVASAVVGADSLRNDARRLAERRLSQHRGSFQNLGIERWRASIENYVASVKPGNQTALNTARVPFANYLNEIHNRIHPIFAEGFLAFLGSLPSTDPRNNMGISTHLEIVLSAEDGHVVKLGVTKSSSVTMFDVGALDSVKRSSPFGKPPEVIVSSDGNVYLHWEFHRREEWACSTYFAHPYLLNLGKGPGEPSLPPSEHGEKHGALMLPGSPYFF